METARQSHGSLQDGPIVSATDIVTMGIDPEGDRAITQPETVSRRHTGMTTSLPDREIRPTVRQLGFGVRPPRAWMGVSGITGRGESISPMTR